MSSRTTDRNQQHVKDAALKRLDRLVRRHETAAIASSLMLEAATQAARDAGATLEEIGRAAGVTRQAIANRLDRKAPADANGPSPEQDQLV